MSKSSIKANFIYNSIYQILTILLPLVTTPYISRVLGADGIGTYSYGFSIAKYFVLFAMLGLNNYGNRSISAIRDNKEELSKTFWGIYYMQLMTASISSIIYLLLAIFVFRNLVIFIMFFYVISSVFDINWFFFGIENFKLTVTRNIIIKVLSVVSIFIFVKKDTDVNIYCFILSFSLLLSQLLILPFLKKYVSFLKPKQVDIKSHFKNNLVLFIPVIAVSLYKTMDKIMLGSMSGMTEVGYYENSEKIIDIPISLIQSLGIVMLPRMSNLLANNKKSESVKYIQMSIMFSVFLSSSLSFGIMALSKNFVPWFYGENFTACIGIFMVLTPSTLFMAVANVVRTQYLIPMHKDRVYITSVFLGALINIIINVIFIPKYNALGAAIGTLLAEGLVCVYQVMKIRKEVDIDKSIIKSIPFVLIGGIMCAVLWFWKISFSKIIYLLIVKFLVGAGIFIFFTLFYSFIFQKLFHKKLY